MSEYKEFVKDFAQRTHDNLVVIEKIQKSQLTEAFEFTQLVNSLLGLLIIPQQVEYESINENFVNIATLDQLQKSIIRTDNDRKDFKNIITRMRNAIAHGRIKIVSESGDIKQIRFTDIDKRGGNGTFIIQLSCESLRNFVEDFSENLKCKL